MYACSHQVTQAYIQVLSGVNFECALELRTDVKNNMFTYCILLWHQSGQVLASAAVGKGLCSASGQTGVRWGRKSHGAHNGPTVILLFILLGQLSVKSHGLHCKLSQILSAALPSSHRNQSNTLVRHTFRLSSVTGRNSCFPDKIKESLLEKRKLNITTNLCKTCGVGRPISGAFCKAQNKLKNVFPAAFI